MQQSILPEATPIDLHDSRLPKTWKVERQPDSSVKLVLKESISVPGFLVVVTLAGLSLAGWHFSAWEGLLLFGSLSLPFAIGFTFHREEWHISSGLVETQWSFLGLKWKRQYTGSTLLLKKTLTGDAETMASWDLSVVDEKQHRSLFTASHPAYYPERVLGVGPFPPIIAGLGSFLSEHTGWPLVLPEV